MKKETICRLCSACCPVQVETRNNRLVSARRRSALPGGKVVFCPKLKAAPDITYSPERLRRPLIKDQKGGANGFREASWDEALDLVADKFNDFKKKSGPESVCWLRGMAADWGAPWDYVNRLMNLFGSPNSIGNGSVCHVGREMAHMYTYGAMTVPEPNEAACIVVWGKNDPDTNPSAYEQILHGRQRGAKLIVVDPVRTELATTADVWLQIKPGYDGMLAMAMINEIIAEKLYDEAFVSEWTTGFETLKAAARDYAPEKVAAHTWLDPRQIKTAAELYAASKPACIIDGNGLDMQLNVFEHTRAICMLRALTGNIDKKGGDTLPQPVPVRNIQLKERLPKTAKPITSDHPLFNEFHETWGLHAQSCIVDAILYEKPYPLKMLVVQSANPAVTMADSRRVARALKRLEFMVVIDLFMTRTAKHADVVLPASGCFERTQLNRAFMRNNFVMLQNKVIDPIGESRPDWEIIFDLARRLGLGEAFPWKTVEEAIDYQLAPAGITVAMLRDRPDGIRVREMQYEKYKTKGFDTPSGKVEFFSTALEKHGHLPVPDFSGPAEHPASFYDQKDEYPFIGISGARTSTFTHSQFKNISSLMKKEPEGFIDIHPEDAAEQTISDGDALRVETPRGHVVMKARISDVVHRGSVRIAWGWGEIDPDRNLNNLTDDDRRSEVTCTPSCRTFMCKVSKAASP